MKTKKEQGNKANIFALFTLLTSLGNNFLIKYIIAQKQEYASRKTAMVMKSVLIQMNRSMYNKRRNEMELCKQIRFDKVESVFSKNLNRKDENQMARSEKQKLKLLYLMQYMLEKTDEDHVVTTQELIEYLAANGITAERKSIYTDMDSLIDYGMDIIKKKERPAGYYLASRQFELAELKLLVDSVQSSKFITTKKSRELIAKLESLCSKNEAKQLHRQVVVTNRIKTPNESIYYNVDMIYNAIGENVKVRFQYFEWSVNKEMQLRKNGSFYEVSPWSLTWDDENYYLIAYDSENQMIKHYRVDKMLKIELSVENREGKEAFEHFDIAGYAKKTFGMFAGEEETVTLSCGKNLTGVMIDRFGKEVSLRSKDEERIQARVNVAVSRQFFGWVTGLGAGVRIESPERVVKEYQNYLQEILAGYQN